MNASSTPLLSRVAESVYWMGRYIERAENVARFAGVNENLTLDLVGATADPWQPIISASGDRVVFAERFGRATRENALGFLWFDAENPNSIYSCVTAARENARSVRETISSEMWERFNSLYLFVSEARSKGVPENAAEFCYQVRMGCHLIHGVTDVTMSHNEAWQFLRLGMALERADKTTRLLDVKYFILLPSVRDVGTPFDDAQWAAVLKSVSGFEMYRKRYGRISPARIVEFLLLDIDFPRAVRFCLVRADQSLHAITGAPMGSYSCASEQRMGQVRSDLDFANARTILREGLHEFSDALQTKMNAIDELVYRDFFAAREAFSTGAA